MSYQCDGQAGWGGGKGGLRDLERMMARRKRLRDEEEAAAEERRNRVTLTMMKRTETHELSHVKQSQLIHNSKF